jgi:arabinan endo-1,5-alpha-L-arabinosidase
MKHKKIGVLLLTGSLLLSACTGIKAPEYPAAPPEMPLYDFDTLGDESLWTINNMHDPSIIRVDDTYYVFSTDNHVAKRPAPGIMVRKSKDLINWNYIGQALKGVPEGAKQWTGAFFLWAPDVVKLGNSYYLYYSASIFGTNKSYIGVASSSSIEGPWTDQGEVIKTDKGDGPNAIDPNIIIDKNGQPWMAYGSFFGGLHILPLNSETGKPSEEGFGTLIATRNHETESGAVEGPYIMYHPEFKKYYLFSSYDSLFEDYNVRVGRSDSITGPYVDINGIELTDTSHEPQYEVGNKILSGYSFTEGEGWIGSGHNSVLIDGDQFYMVHHARGESSSNWSYLHVRKMLWTEEGWPIVSPERYAGESLQTVDQSLITGSWERIVLKPDDHGQSLGEPLVLLKDGEINEEDSKNYWKYDGEHRLTLTWCDGAGNISSEEKVTVIPSWDWELNRPTLVFTGMNQAGIAVWGKKMDPVIIED